MNLDAIKIESSNMPRIFVKHFIFALCGLAVVCFVNASPVAEASLEKSIAAIGSKIYSDREYKIAAMPEYLVGAAILMSENNDREEVGEGTLSSFVASKDSDMYVAYMIPNLPDSYSAFSSTDKRILITGYLGKSRPYHVWEATLPAGEHTFGGVNTRGAYGLIDSPFFLFDAHKSKIGNFKKKNLKIVDDFDVGSLFYMDRDYTIADLPKALVGLTVGLTENNDKMRPDSLIVDLYRISLSGETKVYVATGTGGIPYWLRDYERMPRDQNVRVQFPRNKEKPSSTQYFTLFHRKIRKGERVELGFPTDHKGSSKNMYITFVVSSAN